jgi:sulfoxide reductase heme-binding subunit YedZ
VSVSIQPVSRSSNQPLGTSGDQGRRFLWHHVPLAVASAVGFVLWMTLPLFQGAGHQGPPQAMQHAAQAGGHQGTPQEAGDLHVDGREDQTRDPDDLPDELEGRLFMARATTATGYIAVGLLAFTLLIGPANLLLGKRNPISSYLRRDAGAWTAIVSVIHVIVGFQVHGPPVPLGERIPHYFLRPDGGLLTNSFGLGNWTGLAATVIVVGLLAISSDLALRKLGAGPWKWLQRLNYALFAMVIAHAIFYGALLRVTSASTVLLGLSVVAVVVGQAGGTWLWRRRYQ